MRSFVAAVVFSAGVALAVPAAAQEAFVASEDAPDAAAGGEQKSLTGTDVYTAFSQDFHLLVGFGTEGPTNGSTGARTCAAGLCAWAAGLHVPSGSQIRSIEFSYCDGDSTQQLTFWLIRGPKVPGDVTVLTPFFGTGIPATPGCTTFTATLPTPVTVRNSMYSYAFVVNSHPGANLVWTDYRATYKTATSGDVAVR